jgi:hypothetical protein
MAVVAPEALGDDTRDQSPGSESEQWAARGSNPETADANCGRSFVALLAVTPEGPCALRPGLLPCLRPLITPGPSNASDQAGPGVHLPADHNCSLISLQRISPWNH